MASIPTYEARAVRKEPPDIDFSTGGPEIFKAFALAGASLADKLGAMADRKKVRERATEGTEHALAAAVPSASSILDASTDAGRVVKYFEGRGYSDVAARAIAGQLKQESNFNTGAIGDDGTAFGLAQWRGDRRSALEAFAASRGASAADFDTQLAFFDSELSGSEAFAGGLLREAGSDEDAATALMHFFRPAGYTRDNPAMGHGYDARLANARALAELGGEAAPSPPALRLRQGSSIGDEAYNQAALNVYTDRLDSSSRQAMWTLADTHKGDPLALANALDAYAAGVKGQLPIQVRPIFEATFQRERLSLVREAAGDHRTQLLEEQKAAFEDGLATRKTALIRLATRGGTDEKANAAIAAEIEDFNRFVNSHVEIAPTSRAETLRLVASDVAAARILGRFDKAATSEERAAIATGFQAAWENGEAEAASIDHRAFMQITAQMEQRLGRDVAEREEAARRIDDGIDSLMRRVEKGYEVPIAERTGLKSAVETSGSPALVSRFAFAEELADWTTRNRGQRPEFVEAQIENMEELIREEGATESALASLEVMRGLHTAMTKGLQDDPLAWAERARRIALSPLDTSSDEALTQSLVRRRATAGAVSKIYGIPKPFFRSGEVAIITKAIADNPQALIAFARTMPAALGSDTPLALAEISEDAPLIAHAVGLAQASGNERLLVETADAIGLRRIEGYQPLKLDDGQERQTTMRLLGPALMRQPELEVAALQQARALFEIRARALGIEPKTESDAAMPLFAQAIDDALGGSTRDGMKFGGIAEVNGSPTIIPADMLADRPQAILDELTDADLARLAPTWSANGVPIRAADLAGAHLVRVGDGRYEIAIGWPGSDDPRYVMASPDAPWVLDIRQLAAIQASRPTPRYRIVGGKGGAVRVPE